jgi:hypothetical protein
VGAEDRGVAALPSPATTWSPTSVHTHPYLGDKAFKEESDLLFLLLIAEDSPNAMFQFGWSNAIHSAIEFRHR